jgi:hypothetical protein
MSNFGRFPVSFRYLKARLRVLKRRPQVWGTASGLVAIGLVAAMFWLTAEDQSDRNTYRPNSTGVASLDDFPTQNLPGILPSAEDSAIGADIDSLPTLLNDLNDQNAASGAGLGANPDDIPVLPQQPLSSDLESANSLLNRSQNNLPEASQSRPTAGTNSLTSGFGSSAFSPIEAPSNSASGDRVPDNMATGSNSELFNPDERSDVPAATPLESALERNSAANNANSAGRSPSNSVLSSPIRQNNPYQTAPPPGTTGYIQPPSLNVPANNPAIQSNPTYPNFANPQPAPGLPTAPQIAPNVQQPQGGNSNPNQISVYPNYYNPPVVQPQVTQPVPQVAQPEPINNSVQRSGLGRPIGGGEINTFSNP